jgi:hypothetical protein
MVASIPHGHWKSMTFITGLRRDRLTTTPSNLPSLSSRFTSSASNREALKNCGKPPERSVISSSWKNEENTLSLTDMRQNNPEML